MKNGIPRESLGSVAINFAPKGLVCRMRLVISDKTAMLA